MLLSCPSPSTSTSDPTTSPSRSAPMCAGASPPTPKWLPPKWFYDDRGSDAVRPDHPAARVLPDPLRAGDPRSQRAAAIVERSQRRHAGRARLGHLGEDPHPARRLHRDADQLARFVPFDVCEGFLQRRRGHDRRAATPASTCTASSATSSGTSARSRRSGAGSSRSSAAPSATSRRPSGRASSPTSRPPCGPATACSSGPTW